MIELRDQRRRVVVVVRRRIVMMMKMMNLKNRNLNLVPLYLDLHLCHMLAEGRWD
jgi:hypothetical protein